MTFIETSLGIYLNAEVIALIEHAQSTLLITTKNGRQYTMQSPVLIDKAIKTLKLKE